MDRPDPIARDTASVTELPAAGRRRAGWSLIHEFIIASRIEMPSINRPLGGEALQFRLGEEHRARLIDEDLLSKGGRSARTLLKEGPLRVTLVALAAGGTLAEHRADGPITVHVLAGRIRFLAGEDEWTLEAGDLLSLAAAVPHAVQSAEGAEFLLTVASQP